MEGIFLYSYTKFYRIFGSLLRPIYLYFYSYCSTVWNFSYIFIHFSPSGLWSSSLFPLSSSVIPSFSWHLHSGILPKRSHLLNNIYSSLADIGSKPTLNGLFSRSQNWLSAKWWVSGCKIWEETMLVKEIDSLFWKNCVLHFVTL